ncbi:MAG: cupin domain-containing protein [Pyrinomonadaceae bacterium]|nr:cupin domain-containing protein [Pyrinomonadaceae bacterium]MBP6212274.1 cupin domain-containing protein [Pyrinomonadaceae bacterium]
MSKEPEDRSELNGVVSAAGLVEFQTGSVISRTIVKKTAGTVTAFAFDSGEGLSEHTAPFDALVMNLEGEAEISIAGVPHKLVTGDLLKLPAGVPHAVKAVTPFKMLLIMIKA